jgi:hypothetical protein
MAGSRGSPCRCSISHPLWASGVAPSRPSRYFAHVRKPLLRRSCNGAFKSMRPCARRQGLLAPVPHWRPRLPDPRSARMWERQHPPFDLPRGVPSRPGPARRSHGDDPPTTRQNRGRPTSVPAGGDRRGASGRRPPTSADPCGHRLLPLGSSPQERSLVSSSGTQRAFLSRHSSHPQHGS